MYNDWVYRCVGWFTGGGGGYEILRDFTRA